MLWKCNWIQIHYSNRTDDVLKTNNYVYETKKSHMQVILLSCGAWKAGVWSSQAGLPVFIKIQKLHKTFRHCSRETFFFSYFSQSLCGKQMPLHIAYQEYVLCPGQNISAGEYKTIWIHFKIINFFAHWACFSSSIRKSSWKSIQTV